LLAIYLCEAVHLVSEGMPPERIDREFRRLGMRRGPLETLDLIGFDTVARWVEQLTPSLEVSNLRLERMRSLGWNGASNGEGFYRYRRGKKWENEIARMVLWRSQEDDCLTHYVTDADEAMRTGIDRVLLRTANEAIRMLEESISPETIDLLTARGLKLLPHQGGILTYAEERGLHELQDRLLEFCDRFGKRFEPCEELQRRVELGEGLQLITGEIPARRLRRAG
jgi:3-hydroxyacyl-CoA dehydrogenase/enoyl-CoA hydratase/3-hydroxybutyryl-CoA epimerase